MKSIKRAYITVVIIAVTVMSILKLWDCELLDLLGIWTWSNFVKFYTTAIFVIIVIICVEMIYNGYINEKNRLGFFEKYIGINLALLVLLSILVLILTVKHYS